MNIASSGTYKIHKTHAPYGTIPARVRPLCGQSTSRSYLSVIDPANADMWMTDAATPGRVATLCKKCFG